MNKRNVTRPSVKEEVKAPNRPQQPFQTPPVPPAGAPSRVEVAERLAAHAQRDSILAAYCAAVGQPVPAQATADNVVKLLEKAAWDSRLAVEALTSWLGSMLDAADAGPQPPARPQSLRARVASAKAVDLRSITAESNAAVRDLFQVAGRIALYLECVAEAQAETNAARKRVADLEAELVAARAELEKAATRRGHYSGAADANGELAQELADLLEGSAHWELLADTPIGTFANLGELLAAQRRTENLNPVE